MNFRRLEHSLGACLLCLAALIAVFCTGQVVGADDDLRSAQQLFWAGNYAESEERFERFLETHPIEAAIGKAEIYAATGRDDQARFQLEETLKPHPDRVALQALLAQLAWKRGDFDGTRDYLTPAVRKSARGRWLQAELYRQSGNLTAAQSEYRGLIQAYRTGEVTEPDELVLVGRAFATQARWTRNASDFRFLVKEFYPGLIEQFTGFWWAPYEAGLLYLEKFNQADAARQFEQALKLNPLAAEVHAAKAHLALQRYDVDTADSAIARALAINPNLLAARLAKADLMMLNFDVKGAAEYLEQAQELSPIHEETLGRLAAAYSMLDRHQISAPEQRSPRVEQLIADVLRRNSAAGEFFFTLGTRLEERRRFDLAIHYFQRAQQCMPQLIGPHASLGMLYMRMGQESEAQSHLEKAFEVDPFNVRVSNTLQVLEVLEDYETVETEHFVIRFDPKTDRLLARYTAAHLEAVYPEICQSLDYEPEEKSLIEIFNRARNTGGHGWFAARAIGLPYVGTVGACTGKMIAMTSPTEGTSRFNWARVLKHEFVHVVNLQQTNFNIPHWFTEALAVWHEGCPRPAEWNQLLKTRVPEGRIFRLADINLGFIRPESSEDWQMAYCQAELYAEYMRDRFGEDAFAKLLAAYADDLDTAAAIEQSFRIDVQHFERGYEEYLSRVVESLQSSHPTPRRSLIELRDAVTENPTDWELRSALAETLFDLGDLAGARQQAEQVQKHQPRHAMASYVMAKVHLANGDKAAARKLLADSDQPETLHIESAALLASLQLDVGAYDEAVGLYRRLSMCEPAEVRWFKGQAKAALLARQDEPLYEALASLAEIDPDDPLVRKKLAEMALERENYPDAANWARRTLDIDVVDPRVHEILAQALRTQGELRQAAEEFGIAVELAPGDPHLRYSLAEACLAAGDVEQARAVIGQLLRVVPDYPGAKEFLEKLKP